MANSDDLRCHVDNEHSFSNQGLMQDQASQIQQNVDMAESNSQAGNTLPYV